MESQFLDEIKADLLANSSADNQIKFLVDIGTDLEEITEENRSQSTKVEGCISDTHVSGTIDNNQNMQFKGYSDSLVVRGYLVIIINSLNNQNANEIIKDGKKYAAEICKRS